MKIGIFTDSYFPQINGVTYTIHLWKRELERLGHEVFIYYPKNKEYTSGEREVALHSIPFPFYKGYEIGLPSFKRIEKDLDIVHLQSPATVGLLGMAIARKYNIPCIITYHTPPDCYMREIVPVKSDRMHETLKKGYFKYEKRLLERCNLVTSPSATVVDLLRERHGDVISEAVFFSNGIDLDFFGEADDSDFRKKYQIPEGKIIGFAGRHSTEKHLEDLIALADDFDGTILIGGLGPCTKRYVELAQGKNNIKFLGFMPREELPAFYSTIDLLVLPSTAETEGLVVLEANACETPAVGADAMALKSTITAGLNGYNYEPGNINDLKNNVEKAYKNLEKLKTGAKKRARERSVENTVKQLVKIYKDLEGRGLHRK